MLCVKCGSEVSPGEKFCTHCGERVLSETADVAGAAVPVVSAFAPAQESAPIPVQAPPAPESAYASAPVQAPVQPPVYAQQQPYAPTPTKVPKPKKERRSGGLKFRLLQVPVGIILAGLMFFFIFMEGTVSISTLGSEHFAGSGFSLFHIISTLMFGTGRFNPSVLSIAMGASALLFIAAASVFWLISALAALIHKGENGMRRISVILTFIALAMSCALPPMAYRFVPQFKYIYARNATVLVENVSGVSGVLIYVWAGVVALLTVVLWVLAFKCNKKERLVTENEK